MNLSLNAGPEEALEAAVWALGGWQRAAAEVWPAGDPITGGRKLRNALDPERREQLSPAEIEQLAIAAARAGCLDYLARLAKRCGCRPPERVPPEEVRDRALDAVMAAAVTLREALDELKRIEPSSIPGAPLRRVR